MPVAQSVKTIEQSLARLAGRNRTDFYKLMSRHGIDPAEFKASERAVPATLEANGRLPKTSSAGVGLSGVAK